MDLRNCDGHVHTYLCRHACGTMEEYVRAGIQKKLRKLIFLEHMEEGIISPRRTWLSEEEFDYYFEEGQRLREIYGDQIEIGLGVECGYNPDYSEQILRRLQKRKWDAVGLSCHFILVPEVSPHHINLLSHHKDSIENATKAGPAQLLTKAFSSLTEGIGLLPVTKVCHLDAPLRYLALLQDLLEPAHYEQIEGLFELMAKRDIALEINSSGIDIRNEPFPSRRILKIARKHELKLEFGSDAHHPEKVGCHFDKLHSLLQEPIL